MEISLHHLLMTNHTAFRKRIFSALKNEGLTSGQPKVLEYLAQDIVLYDDKHCKNAAKDHRLHIKRSARKRKQEHT